MKCLPGHKKASNEIQLHNNAPENSIFAKRSTAENSRRGSSKIAKDHPRQNVETRYQTPPLTQVIPTSSPLQSSPSPFPLPPSPFPLPLSFPAASCPQSNRGKRPQNQSSPKLCEGKENNNTIMTLILRNLFPQVPLPHKPPPKPRQSSAILKDPLKKPIARQKPKRRNLTATHHDPRSQKDINARPKSPYTTTSRSLQSFPSQSPLHSPENTKPQPPSLRPSPFATPPPTPIPTQSSHQIPPLNPTTLLNQIYTA